MPPNDNLKEASSQKIDSQRDLLLQVSRFIHSHPEPNYKEFQSSKYLVEILREEGFEVEFPYGGLETSFRATIRGGSGNGPHVVILAEFDALPVTMPDGSSPVVHACGHNLNCSAALGAALGLKSIGDRLYGTASIIGTPAEEGGGGKIKLLHNGGFQNVDALMIVHGDQRDWYTIARACTASEFIHITFSGKPPSGGYSRNYVNALDALVLFLNALSFLDSHLTPDSLIQRRVLPDSRALNTIPLTCSIDVQVRSGDESYLDWMKKQVMDTARGAAQAIGADVKFEGKGFRYEKIIENKTLEDVGRSNVEFLGHKFTYDEPSPYPFGTDTGNLSHQIPTIQFLIGRPEGFSFHTPIAVEQSISDSAQAMMIESAKILAATSIDLMMDPSIIARAKEELAEYQSSGFVGLYSWHKIV
jgi:amidohydrolase